MANYTDYKAKAKREKELKTETRAERFKRLLAEAESGDVMAQYALATEYEYKKDEANAKIWYARVAALPLDNDCKLNAVKDDAQYKLFCIQERERKRLERKTKNDE